MSTTVEPQKYKENSIESFIQTCYTDGLKNNPTSFQFDSSNDLIYFLSLNNPTKDQKPKKMIHYIDMKSDNKTPTPLFNYVDSEETLSLEAQLQRERQRVMDDGITQYSFNKDTQTFIVPIGNSIHQIDIDKKVKEIPGSAYLQTLSQDSKLVAFISENNIWVTDISSGTKHQLTNSNGPYIKNGDIGFVYAEEFSRYTGYWWSPIVEKDSNGNDSYTLFYIREDETKVREFLVPKSDYKGGVTTYKYPLAGDENSVVSLHLIKFSIANNQISITNTDLFDLKQQFPWMEYIVRANFTPDGANVWCQLLDRNQQHLALILIPLDKFTSTPTTLPILVEENSDYWINVVDLIYFCKKSPNQLIWSSESSGYRHLYLITWDPISLTITEKRPITQSNKDAPWLVNGDKLFVDEDRKFVYFTANKETPLEAHLYVASFALNNDPTKVSRLTKPKFCHSSIEISDNFTRFVSTSSNLSSPLEAHVYKLDYSNRTHDFPTTTPFFQIQCDTPSESKPSILKHLVPENFTFKNSHGVELYGQVIKPESFNPDLKYPTVLYVYGGPHVQIVRNQYEWSRSRSIYARLGFIVVMIDGMGSSNRGIEFEGKLRCKMGAIEIKDQIEGLEYLINQGVPIDRQRIAISGWSYGGYLALMGIAQRPDFFKIAISGAPVTLWESYNTGYTERYMGVPKDNVKGYEISNVSHYINNFPSQDNRLIIIHGLQDENVHFAGTQVLLEQLTSHHKPYILKLLVKERHSIRNLDTRIYIEAHNLKHLLSHL